MAVGKSRIRVVFGGFEGSYPPDQVRLRQGLVRACVSPQTEVDFDYLDAPISMYGNGAASPEQLQQGADGFARNAIKAERDGFDAVTLYGNADVGLEEARRQVRIPVFGWGQVSLHMASLLAPRFGVIVYDEDEIPSSQERAERYGLTRHIVGFKSTGMPNAVMAERQQELRERLVDRSKELVSQGAQLILPWGISMIPVNWTADALSEAIGVPVVDTMLVAMRTIEIIVDAGLTTRASEQTMEVQLP